MVSVLYGIDLYMGHTKVKGYKHLNLVILDLKNGELSDSLFEGGLKGGLDL